MREKRIDNAKGIAILLVIIGHVSGGLTGIWNFQFVYGIHLVVFFILSGYTLKKAALTKDFINKKFSRLMVPYFYTCIAIIIADVFNSWYLNQDASIMTVTYLMGRDLVRSFFASGSIQTFGSIDLGTRIGAIWFLPAMFFAILIFQYLLNKISDSKILGISCALVALSGYISARFIWFPFSIQSGMLAVFFVWIGYEIKRKNLLSKIVWQHYVAAQIILLLGIFYGYCNISFVSAYMNDILLSIPIGLAGCLLIYLLSMIDKSDMLFGYIGRISLSILCVHLFSLEIMGVYFDRILNTLALSGNLRIWVNILFQIIFAVVIAVAIEMLKGVFGSANYQLMKKIKTRENKSREVSIDVAKGFLIFLMIVGHFTIDGNFRTIIYSCHMAAFVLFSGYFYKTRRNIFQTFQKMIWNFIFPYLLFVGGIILLNYNKWNAHFFRDVAIQYGLGLSFSNCFFTKIPSVGPVYFILMLFIVRLIYMVMDHILKREHYKWYATIILSFIGMKLGVEGVWLPWSIDVALYSLIFYRIGICIRQYNILQKIRDSHISYFLLTPIWAYMIYSGGMEIAIRTYGQYGLTIVGAAAGILMVYKLAFFVTNHMPICREVLRLLGEGSIVVIIIHTLLGKQIEYLVSMRFDSAYLPSMICQICIQVMIALIIKYAINSAKAIRA